jgi:4-amino-4-deoxy-L-arabinose transferase-like glycosyltransferase
MRGRFDCIGQFAALKRIWEKHPGMPWALSALWVLGLSGVVFLWHLGSVGLIDETEPLFAEAARQMTVTGDWVTPYFNGNLRFDKPPLVYWLMAIAYQTIGVNEWAVRLPSALAAIGLVGMVFYSLRQFGMSPLTQAAAAQPCRWLPAWIGAGVMALHPLTIAWGRTGVSDMLLSTCVGLALLMFFHGYAQTPDDSSPRRLSGWYGACYCLIALAILTKGPIGFVLPALIISVFLVYVGQVQVWRDLKPLWGMGMILAIALPWYALVTIANGTAFIESFFGYHNFERFTEVVNRHQAPWYFYFIVVLLGFAPWSVYLPVAIGRLQVWRRSVWRHQPRSQQFGLFVSIWFAVIFGFFTIAVTKLPSYVLPLMPAAAILIALFWTEQMAQPVRRWGIVLSGLLNGGLSLGLVIVLFFLPQWLAAEANQPQLAALIQASGLVTRSAAICLVSLAIGAWLLLKQQAHWLWLVNIGASLILISGCLLPALFLIDSQRQLPLRQLAQQMRQEIQPGERVIMVGYEKPSVVFYSQQSVRFIRDGEDTSRRLRRFAKKDDTTAVLVIGDRGDVNDIGLKPGQFEPLGQAGAYELLRIPAGEFTKIKPRKQE